MGIQPLDIMVDVSDNNPSIDWSAAYVAGVRVAAVKIIEYPDRPYPTGPMQLEGARKAGIATIPYGFLRPVNVKSYIREFAARCDLGPGMVFALDWEGRASQTAEPPAAEAIGEELALIARRPPLGYWGIPGATPAAPTFKMQQWERWVPRYPVIGANRWLSLPFGPRDNPDRWWLLGNAKGLPRFGQYTAWGRVAGIPGLVDRSVAFAPSVDDVLAWLTGKVPQSAAAAAQDAGKPTAAPHTATTAPTASGGHAAPPQRDPGDEDADQLNQQELHRLSGESGQ